MLTRKLAYDQWVHASGSGRKDNAHLFCIIASGGEKDIVFFMFGVGVSESDNAFDPNCSEVHNTCVYIACTPPSETREYLAHSV